MLTDKDYQNYFTELEDMYKKMLLISTDLINELIDQSIRNKLYVMVSEDEASFKAVKEFKSKFFNT